MLDEIIDYVKFLQLQVKASYAMHDGLISTVYFVLRHEMSILCMCMIID